MTALKDQENTREEILIQNMDLVHRIARNYSQMVQSHYEDLVQVGAIGLLNAIKRYDPERKINFRTYAAHLIASEIKHYLRDQLPVVRPPRELQELLPKVRNAELHLLSTLGREGSQEEISEHLGISQEKLEEVRHLEKNFFPISLDQDYKAFQEGTTSILDQLEDRRYKSFQLAQEDRILLQDALKKVRFQSRQILEFAFYQDLTQTEIAKNLGISQMQVSRRLKKALGELWDSLNTRITPW
ncbi:RNA polymerase subunit sigma [bacterium (Candidatus Blackallbacteria) CG17_big_fil_post_rev_8_21_14_2_50_48_46]|uniref:RNA polymerase subunit sigma n=1 Tax=bacterium (Candidatus Blackallbacteria) CG17_big_fil_post_rev_8_21_14_2_50_48_46 TaxID=2014261 RepID=A0A2M7GA28_9BACT|nr:MAG: RNA polymerase subunit sigma [bacterium (Candidatus Blackallbacteria) CG18_big_fil_WC_8_21_14_2_50_49_26]PIW19000.1 MAG: RNA polymerase subunit sigma [bacterium (Candidatus Blackallbacteria) CG17_big_fil_post_rev_8_21_14_2_50_48_46]PIW44632.1 MAG: RNA polymerase subunit sigma [bacterium (Candidatus Blackallbacteria) CG13_big_fil_rev_8_21_14_2_50_49_14]